MISVIVCVYNGEKTIKKCVNSILSQTYKELEIIIVNDGSKDSTASICDEYHSIYNNVKVIHQDNAGVAEARNHGISEALGEYFTFVDADDWIDADYYKRIFDEVNDIRDYDCIISGFTRVVPGQNSIKVELSPGSATLTKPSLDYWTYYEKNMLAMGVLWNKIYKKSKTKENKITMPLEVTVMSDVIFNLRYFTYCKNVFFVTHAPYNYVYDSDSLMNAIRVTSIDEKMQFYSELSHELMKCKIPKDKFLFFEKFMGEILEINIFHMANQKGIDFINKRKNVKYMASNKELRKFYSNIPAKGFRGKFKKTLIMINCPLLIIGYAYLKKLLRNKKS